MINDLVEACGRADADVSVGAIVIRANGPSFYRVQIEPC